MQQQKRRGEELEDSCSYQDGWEKKRISEKELDQDKRCYGSNTHKTRWQTKWRWHPSLRWSSWLDDGTVGPVILRRSANSAPAPWLWRAEVLMSSLSSTHSLRLIEQLLLARHSAHMLSNASYRLFIMICSKNVDSFIDAEERSSKSKQLS